MDLKELGSRIREERERQNLTIEQVMELTKISRVNINAIENGNQKDFPHEVYAKGFIKNYAKILGLDADEIGEEFSKIMSSSIDPEDIYQTEAVQGVVSESERKFPLKVILLIVLLAAIVGGLVYYLHDSSVLNLVGQGKEEIVAVEEAPAQPESTVSESVSASEDNEATVKEEPVAEESVTVEEQAAPAEAEVAVVETPAVAEAGNSVIIRTRPGESCWLEAVVDGNRREYVLQDGDTLSLSYNEKLQLKLGNAGGVAITADGKPYEFDASANEVKNLEFPAAR